MGGFQKFLLRGNVVDLAVGVVIGAAFGAVVTALVKDLITPLIAAVGGTRDFSALSFSVGRSTFAYGDFLNALVSFLLIAAVVYVAVVLPVNGLISRFRTEPDVPSPTRACPECLSQIPVGARRCAFCTAEVPTATVVG